nr:reverse transcriptase domain-containing protein [Tanacetum cinerariifolium]
MEPKRTTKSSPATTTSVTDAQLKALIDQGIARALAARDDDRTRMAMTAMFREQAENKRKDDNNNQARQQTLKKQGVAIAHTAEPGERKEYVGTLPLCNKCKFHHNGQCTV